MLNPFIPKDNYISRIADRLEKQKIKNLIKLHIENSYLLPKDLKIIIPKDVSISKERLIKEAYKEFLKDVGMTDVELDNYLKRRAIVLASNLGILIVKNYWRKIYERKNN